MDAESHDRIEVRGARENNLANVSLDIPKRRLTVFTGVSGSGKSSLVFGTIAAESRRLINETYTAFIQSFMPNLARPDVDALRNLTAAIIVDQERMGGNPRSTVGTATDAYTMLRIIFSRLGEPHVGPSTAFSFNIPAGRARARSSWTAVPARRSRGRSRCREACAPSARGSGGSRRSTSTSWWTGNAP
jgi:excinuclease UvrABC ATPase subunit